MQKAMCVCAFDRLLAKNEICYANIATSCSIENDEKEVHAWLRHVNGFIFFFSFRSAAAVDLQR